MPLPLYKNSGSHIKKVIGIAAGKGGVGKSFVAVSLARALQRKGYKVGLLDADLYGPSLKKMLPENRAPTREGDRLIPAQAEGIALLSMAHFKDEGEGVVIRAPLASKLIEQFIKGTDWGDLDFLLIDFPPGTADIAISIAQIAPLEGTILVTTPQEVALLDVRRAAKMFCDTGIKLIGIVENMSYFLDPETGKRFFPFGQGGGAILSHELQIPLLAEIPLEPNVGRLLDLGFSLFLSEQPSLASVKNTFNKLAEEVALWKPVKAIRAMRKVSPEAFQIDWEDGIRQQFILRDLQEKCPCAKCQGHGSVSGPVRAKGVSEAGRYAIRIDFETGCNHGIFPYEYLRKLGKPAS